MKKLLSLTLLAALVCNAAFAETDAEKAFAKLKTLVGTWKGGSEMEGMDATITFKLTGAGSTLVETQLPGTAMEMVTVYHMDGPDKLICTHYCAAGNQPSMKMVKSGKDNQIKFDFLSGSNMKPADMHMHSVLYTFKDADHFTSEWTAWMDGKPGESAKFDMTRVK